jgi:hypothetical protein
MLWRLSYGKGCSRMGFDYHFDQIWIYHRSNQRSKEDSGFQMKAINDYELLYY